MIRLLQQKDLNILLDLYQHLHREDAPVSNQEVVHSVWKAIMGHDELKYFGAFVDDTLISTCSLTIIPNLTRSCRPFGLLENVVTHPEHRLQGHGKRVLQHALNDAWSHGCYKVILLSGRKDEGTFRFYESVGFDRHSKQGFLAKAPDFPSESTPSN